MRGLDNLVSAVLLVAITLVIATFVASWIGTFSQDRADTIRNTTRQQLSCQFADLFIRNITYDCNNDCSSGIEHNLTITITNSGKKSVTLDKVVLQNSTGHLISLLFNETKKLSVGQEITTNNLTEDSCSGINHTIDFVKITSTNCPLNAADALPGGSITFLNC